MLIEDVPSLISVTGLLDEPLRSLLHPVEPAIRKMFSFDRLNLLYTTARQNAAGVDALEQALNLLGITYEFNPRELAHIPLTGGAILVSNHPFGLLEGVILATLLPKLRPDIKILANSLLASIPELRPKCIFVNPFGQREAVATNVRALKECLSWVKQGGLLVTFPAGEVAHLNWKKRAVLDPPWNPAVARIAKSAGVPVVPVFFKGGNSLAFQLTGTMHPRMRTASLGRELLNKRGRRVEIRIGRPIVPATLKSIDDIIEATAYLRSRTYLLGDREGGFARRLALLAPKPPQPIMGAVSRAELEANISGLPCERKLAEAGDLAVYVGTAGELPAVVREIGRLREIAFRGAGEGTGKAFDLDRFDRHYRHLVLWNQKAGEVAGAYRLGVTTDILPHHGVNGLYTSTLFRYRRELFDEMGPAVELGRSFIRVEYQKQYAPLLLLWKGIVRYVASRPQCGKLFGGVSISNSYNQLSRHLIVKFLEAHRVDGLAPLVAPRCPYRPGAQVAREGAPITHLPEDIDELSALVSDLESDGKGVPILVKQYWRCGGKLLAFNVDRNFSNALDALIVVDLRIAPDAFLKRYLGEAEARIFATRHARVRGFAA